ncbi:hypothetical protein CFAM422_009218 [Trichoderma lentiforme]|uniref:Uncharacterized protein n=1 Tax=Trichoderma lentiforme TaxID=1567552 RepID=A0A9P4XAM0_9HYPO|nr:hypothetical protein CFAM422_009218 [Trichoderma lentiforme]
MATFSMQDFSCPANPELSFPRAAPANAREYEKPLGLLTALSCGSAVAVGNVRMATKHCDSREKYTVVAVALESM